MFVTGSRSGDLISLAGLADAGGQGTDRQAQIERWRAEDGSGKPHA